MKKKRNDALWVLEPSSRLTVNQQIGGMLYDFIDSYYVTSYGNRKKQLLSCIRYETRMSDRTLQNVFKGKSNSLTQYMRILVALRDWVHPTSFNALWKYLAEWFYMFCHVQGDEFLDQQAILNRPKHIF